MLFVIIGVAFVVMKFAEFGPVAEWAWWWCSRRLRSAVAWWMYADSSGLNKKREMHKMEERKAERRQRNLDNLGLGGTDKREKDARSARERVAERIEGKRTKTREHYQEVVRNSCSTAAFRPSRIAAAGWDRSLRAAGITRSG